MKKIDFEGNLEKMDSLITRKKEEKRRRLLDAAYTCFTSSSISDTSISEICQKAGIAKGTFYLYFNDKEDIVRNLNKRLSYEVIQQSYEATRKDTSDFVDRIVAMADWLIAFFMEDHEIVALMKKDFVWPIGEEEFLTSDDAIMSSIRKDIEAYAKKSGINAHQILVRLYALISMISSTCYAGIIDQFPTDIQTLQPEIETMIRASFAYNPNNKF